jgi:transitional endoplasmic reticulum ATPase
VVSVEILPEWAEELRRRYLRGESSVFVLHGNVHDVVLHKKSLIGVSDFLAHSVLDKKETVIRYNVSTGCRFPKKGADLPGLDKLLTHRSPADVLPVLENILFSHKNVALIIEYAEMVAPDGTNAFATEQDRLAIVTLQRWSVATQLDRCDNVVLLLADIPNELHPKIVANPRVAAVKVPMPSAAERRSIIAEVNADLDKNWIDRFTEITAGLKAVQIKSILQPPRPAEEDSDSRFRFIKSLIGNERRARKLSALTQGMSREEIQDLVGVEEAPEQQEDASTAELNEVLKLIATRKREIIERECFGLIEFVDPSHDFSVVGGLEPVKDELKRISRNIRAGNHSRVPMGLLFTGPMGTGKTFVAEAFVKESGLTGIKLKNFRSKWVGATESNLERILDVVKAIGNVIVIIDEGDRSFGSGADSGGDAGTSSRVVARLKEFMSDTTNRGRVLFVLMTNRPDKLDIDIKRAGRLDRKIPFLYAQEPDAIEQVLLAQLRKHNLKADLEFPRDRETVSQNLLGYSNADLEAIILLAYNYAAEEATGEINIDKEKIIQATKDYLPSRDVEMLEYMELLAVFEASNRKMLPTKYANLSVEELQHRLAELRIRCGSRR